MKIKKIAIFISLVMSVGFILTACGSKATSTPAVQSNPAVKTSSFSGESVVAEGRVVPRDTALLYFVNGGKVDKVLVKEGDVVTQGTVLASLSDRDQFKANVASAQAEATAAQQAFDELNRTSGLAYNQAVLDEITAETVYYDSLKAWDDFDMTKYDDDLDQSKADVADAKKKLEDAKDEFAKYAALDNDNSSRKQAKTNLDTAQTNYDDALAKQAEIENQYRQLKSDLDLARARLDEARRTQEIRKDGPDKDQLDLAQARLDSAISQLSAAKTALDNLDIVAPYDGTVAKVDISAGEQVNPNQSVITFADLSQWFVETTDLTENEIVNIQGDLGVVVVPDALPDLQLNGQIESISNIYTEKSGDIIYKVRVKLLDSNPRLRWGMTTETRFSEPTK